MSGKQVKHIHDVSTPELQLSLLCLVMGNPSLPRQQLNRILQARMAWRPERGLPPTFRRALQQLAEHTPPAPAKRVRKKSVQSIARKKKDDTNA